MKRVHIIGATLFALFTFCAVSVSTALAQETAQWLVDGATLALTQEVNSDVTTNAEGILVEDMNATLKPDVLCLKIVKGLDSLNANGEGEEISFECPEFESMTSGVTCSKVESINLPWLIQLVQKANGVYLTFYGSDGNGAPGWRIECSALGVKVTDTCTGEDMTSTDVNDTSTEEIETDFSETDENEEEADNCTIGGARQFLIQGKFFDDALSVSGLELLDSTLSLTPEVA